MDDVLGSLVRRWTEAWNRHDMPAARRLVRADVDFVTVAGAWLRGGDEFLRHHEAIHRRHMRETTWHSLAFQARPLADGVGLAHVEWTITGERDADDVPRPPRAGVFTWVLVRDGAEWLIAAAHNTNLRADVSHRLAASTPIAQEG